MRSKSEEKKKVCNRFVDSTIIIFKSHDDMLTTTHIFKSQNFKRWIKRGEIFFFFFSRDL
jgi:hypothetical protein